MFFVYGIQAIDDPEGNVKIGFSNDPLTRCKALELGALGTKLHVVFQIEAGMSYGDGRRMEKLYHNEFALLRIDRETFLFDPKMLTWRPDGSTRAFTAMKPPASNTNFNDEIYAVAQHFDPQCRAPQHAISQRNSMRRLVSGDLSIASTAQEVRLKK